MLIDFVYLVLGLVALVFGATWLVDGASSLAKKAGISTLTIGLTVVAFGTSMPELVVNLLASASGSTEWPLVMWWVATPLTFSNCGYRRNY